MLEHVYMQVCERTWTIGLKGKTGSEMAGTSKTIFSRWCMPSEITD